MEDGGGRGPAGLLDGDSGTGGRGPVLGDDALSIGTRGPRGLTDEASYEGQLADFKRRVRERQVEIMLGMGRKYFADVPKSELDTIEGKHRMRKEAAARCRELLAAARAEHSKKSGEGDALAASSSSIGVQSAYRSIDEDTAAWNKTFKKHFQAMKKKQRFAGKELSEAAFVYMVAKMKKFKAPPGYSNHSNGKAVDFKTTHAGAEYAADSSQREGWRQTWLHKWLVMNAQNYDFKPLATEEWHWDYTK